MGKTPAQPLARHAPRGGSRGQESLPANSGNHPMVGDDGSG